jgi:hypothetical protein
LETLGTADNGITPPPTKAFESIVNIEFAIPERASADHRADLMAYVQNYLAHNVVESLVKDLETTW